MDAAVYREAGRVRGGALASIRGRALAWLRAHEALVWGVAILLIAVLVRALWAAFVDPSPRDGRFDDSVWYDSAARNLAEGRGYIYDPSVWRLNGQPPFPGQEGGPTAYWPVGYPLVLAALYALFGPTIVAAKALNVALGAATAVATYALGRGVFGRRAGLLAGGLMAVFPSHVMFSSLVVTEITAAFLLVAAAWLAIRWTLADRHATWHRFVALGVVFGAAAMVRMEMVLLPLAFVPLWWLRARPPEAARRALGGGALAVVGMALLFVPWTVRNAVQMDAFIPFTTGGGGAVLQGHFEGGEGRPDLYVMVPLQAKYAHLPNAEREVRINRDATRQGIEFAVTHPREELTLVPKRLYYLFRQDTAGVDWTQTNNPVLSETAAGRWRDVSNVYYWLVGGVALAGAPLWLRPRDPRRLVIVLPIVYYAALFGVLFMGNERYHVPLLPFVSVAAAASAFALWEAVRGIVGRVVRR